MRKRFFSFVARVPVGPVRRVCTAAAAESAADVLRPVLVEAYLRGHLEFFSLVTQVRGAAVVVLEPLPVRA